LVFPPDYNLPRKTLIYCSIPQVTSDLPRTKAHPAWDLVIFASLLSQIRHLQSVVRIFGPVNPKCFSRGPIYRSANRGSTSVTSVRPTITRVAATVSLVIFLVAVPVVLVASSASRPTAQTSGRPASRILTASSASGITGWGTASKVSSRRRGSCTRSTIRRIPRTEIRAIENAGQIFRDVQEGTIDLIRHPLHASHGCQAYQGDSKDNL